jgi:predicted ferric reductase
VRDTTVERRSSGLAGYAGVVALWLVGLMVPALFWWQHTGPLEGTATIMNAAGRLTGLVAGYTLLTEILLASRLPILHRLGGSGRMQRWHRDLGALLLASTLAHGVLITQAYATFDKLSLYREAWKLLRSNQDMFKAFLATGLLVAAGLLAVRAVRTRLPYELWLVLHRAMYLVLLLGYAHQFSTGQDVGGGPGKLYWTVLHLGVIGALVWGRIVAPLVLNLRHGLQVADVVDEGSDVVSIYLAGRRLDALDARAGQYLRWRFLTGGCWWQSHPFSLSAPRNEHWLRITVKAVGRHTASLRRLMPGTKVWISVPEGEHTAERGTMDRALLIAGGSGIAPIRALLAELPPGAVVLYRASSTDELILRDELEHIALARGARLWYVVGSRHEPGPRRAFTPNGLAELVPDIDERDVYLCGPPGFTDTVTMALRQLRIPSRQVHVSAFEL